MILAGIMLAAQIVVPQAEVIQQHIDMLDQQVKQLDHDIQQRRQQDETTRALRDIRDAIISNGIVDEHN